MAIPRERPATTLDERDQPTAAEAPPELGENIGTFTPWERVQILVASWIGYFAVWLIGRSLRWEIVGWENWEAARSTGKGIIYTFWHCGIFSATWFWRKRGIVVMTSRNFDGEYIARIIQKHGYGTARGSSSRGATRALAEMIKSLRKGRDAAFTIDGPRGPRFVAKAGSVLLAKATGAAILCFHIVPRRAWVFRKSWDRTEIPHPFSQATILIAPSLLVAGDADEEEQERKLRQVQATLDELVKRGEEWSKQRRTNPEA